jgi:hypothetical protein
MANRVTMNIARTQVALIWRQAQQLVPGVRSLWKQAQVTVIPVAAVRYTSPQEIISTRTQQGKIMPGTSTSALVLDPHKPLVVRWLSFLAAERQQPGGSPSLQIMRAKLTVRLDLYM